MTLQLTGGDGTITLVEATYDQPPRFHRWSDRPLLDITEREGRGRRPRAGSPPLPAGVPLRPTGMAWCASTTRRSSTPTSRSPRCCSARSTTSSAAASARSPTPTTSRRPPSIVPASSWASSTPTCSTSATSAATASYVWARHAVSVTEDDGVPLAITHIEDVTEQRRAAEQLRWAATHDELTGLPNRTELLIPRRRPARRRRSARWRCCSSTSTTSRRQRQPRPRHRRPAAAVMAERRLVPSVDGTTLARFGGDEFIVVLCRQRDADDRPRVAERSCAVAIAVDVEGHELFVTASIGYSRQRRRARRRRPAARRRRGDVPGEGPRPRLRRGVRGRVQETTALALRTATELRRGIERGEIVPYYQPIVELTDRPRRRLRGARPLATSRAWAARSRAVPVARRGDRAGRALGEVVLRDGLRSSPSGGPATCLRRRLPRRQRRYPPGGRPGVRRAGRQPARRDRHPRRFAVAGDHRDGAARRRQGLDGGDASSSQPRPAPRRRRLRHRLLVAHLSQALPVEAIKIDRSFVAGLGLDNEDTTIVEAVVNLGHAFGLDVIAEGLETPLQLARLRDSAATAARATCSAAPSRRATARPPALPPTPPQSGGLPPSGGGPVSPSATLLPWGEAGNHEPCLPTLTASVVGTADSPLTPSSSKLSTRKFERSRAASSSAIVRLVLAVAADPLALGGRARRRRTDGRARARTARPA